MQTQGGRDSLSCRLLFFCYGGSLAIIPSFFLEACNEQFVQRFLICIFRNLSPDEFVDCRVKHKCYRFCSLGYQANQYDVSGLSPKEQYKKYADGRDEGLGEIDPDSPAAFAEWYVGRRGGHPWEVCRGGNSTHVSLYVVKDQSDGYYLEVAGSSLWRSVESAQIEATQAMQYRKRERTVPFCD